MPASDGLLMVMVLVGHRRSPSNVHLTVIKWYLVSLMMGLVLILVSTASVLIMG
jgi:hypothetical protein